MLADESDQVFKVTRVDLLRATDPRDSPLKPMQIAEMLSFHVSMHDEIHCVLQAVSSYKRVFARARRALQDQKSAASLFSNFEKPLHLLLVDDKLFNAGGRVLFDPQG